MKTCIIISGGAYTTIPEKNVKDFIIACDKGYDYAKKQNIMPNLIIGDFDSYEGELPAEVEVMKFPPEKDDTDTMIALKTAIKRGFRSIYIYCAFGGRLDHLYANFQTVVYAAKQNVRCQMIDTDNVVTAIQNSAIQLSKREGYALSLFSVSNKCSGVSVTGAKYPLENAELTNTFPLGVSNEWEEDVVNVEVKDGILLIILSRVAENI